MGRVSELRPFLLWLNEWGTFIRFRTDGMAVLKPGLAFDSVVKLVGEEKPQVGEYARGRLSGPDRRRL